MKVVLRDRLPNPGVVALAVALVLTAPAGGARGAEASDPAAFQTPPRGATMISRARYERLRAEGNWFELTPDSAKRKERAALAQDRRDLALVARFARDNRIAMANLVPAEPQGGDRTVTPLRDGNYLHRISLRNGREATVVTYGRRWFLRSVATAIRTFPTRDNQLETYQALYAIVPRDWKARLDLPDPSSARSLSAESLVRLIRRIASPRPATAVLAALQPRPSNGPLPPIAVGCDQEAGAGAGNDRAASVCFPRTDGIVANYNWNLRPYVTCVKAQAARGTCTGFANTSAIEMLVWKKHGARVNLSEQAYYNAARLKWDDTNWKDGHTSILGFQGMEKDGWLLYFERQWNYNRSSSRTVDEAKSTYVSSCVGYTETCSDTTHQGPLFCLPLPLKAYYCGYVVPSKNPGNEGYRIGPSVAVWDAADKQTSLVKMQFFLAAGIPLVLGHPVTSSWDYAANSGRGFMPHAVRRESIRGGHGTHIVGYIDNATLANVLPSAPAGDGGGYFVVKNSWGSCSGDGGFIYASFKSILTHAVDVTALMSVK